MLELPPERLVEDRGQQGIQFVCYFLLALSKFACPNLNVIQVVGDALLFLKREVWNRQGREDFQVDVLLRTLWGNLLKMATQVSKVMIKEYGIATCLRRYSDDAIRYAAIELQNTNSTDSGGDTDEQSSLRKRATDCKARIVQCLCPVPY